MESLSIIFQCYLLEAIFIGRLRGTSVLILDEIFDHQSDGTDIAFADGFTKSRGGNKHRNKTICGLDLLTQMKEGFSKWIPLKDLKDRNRVELV